MNNKAIGVFDSGLGGLTVVKEIKKVLSHEDIIKWNKWALKQTNMSSGYLMRMLIRPKEWPRIARAARYAIPYIFSK